jgi:hypothetical protein
MSNHIVYHDVFNDIVLVQMWRAFVKLKLATDSQHDLVLSHQRGPRLRRLRQKLNDLAYSQQRTIELQKEIAELIQSAQKVTSLSPPVTGDGAGVVQNGVSLTERHTVDEHVFCKDDPDNMVMKPTAQELYIEWYEEYDVI